MPLLHTATLAGPEAIPPPQLGPLLGGCSLHQLLALTPMVPALSSDTAGTANPAAEIRAWQRRGQGQGGWGDQQQVQVALFWGWQLLPVIVASGAAAMGRCSPSRASSWEMQCFACHGRIARATAPSSPAPPAGPIQKWRSVAGPALHAPSQHRSSAPPIIRDPFETPVHRCHQRPAVLNLRSGGQQGAGWQAGGKLRVSAWGWTECNGPMRQRWLVHSASGLHGAQEAERLMQRVREEAEQAQQTAAQEGGRHATAEEGKAGWSRKQQKTVSASAI
ncbi:hypothetical protein ABBQ38_005489 [Trebouxia sp. C0009 RCD-2024]